MGLAVALFIGHTRLGRLALLSLDALPFHHRGSQDHASAEYSCKNESYCQGVAVRRNDSIELVLRHYATVRGRASVNDSFGVQALNSGETVDELAGEDVLTDGNEDGAAKLLHEEHQRCAKRNVIKRQDCLRRQVGGLEATTNANAVKDLVANPVAAAGVRSKSRKHTAADSAYRARQQHSGNVVSDALSEDGG